MFVMPRRRPIRIAARIITWLVTGLVIAVLAIIAILFLWIGSLPWAWTRVVVTAVYLLLVASGFIFLKPRWKGVAVFAVSYAAVWLWYEWIPASNDRDWQPDVARVASVAFSGNEAVVTNVRGFAYRSVDDYDAAWETRTYDLDAITSLDLIFSYWGPREIAHTMLSFGFAGGDFLAVSVETRKEMGETYDPLRSFFKQFELIYILGDERDVLALRSNHRLEDMYIFPVDWSPAKRRALLVDVLERADELGREPTYYATLEANCTTSLLAHIERVDKPVPFSIGLLLNGYIPELAYERGNLPNDAPFEEVMQRYAVSERAVAGGDGEGYSSRIRAGIQAFDGASSAGD